MHNDIPAGSPARGTKDQVSSDLRDLQATATETMHDLRDKASSAMADVKQRGGELAADAGQQVRGIVESQKSAGADAIDSLASAAHSAAAELEPKVPQVARAVHEAAATAERMSQQLRERSLGDLVGSVTDFARREPLAFFAGTVLAGLVLARFIKSSAHAEGDHSPHRRESEEDRSVRSDGNGGMRNRYGEAADSMAGAPRQQQGGGYGAPAKGAAG